MYDVLIVDDVKVIRDTIKLLGAWEANHFGKIYEAGDAQEALTIICEKEPQLVITDMQMPVMDGTTLLKKIDELGICCQVIVISGFSDFKYTRLAIQKKVIDYILKPIDPDELNRSLTLASKKIQETNPLSLHTDNELVNELILFIDTHYCEKVSLNELATHFHVSKEHLARIFKKKTGATVGNYILDKKIEKACTLLKGSSLSIEDISNEVGFTDNKYFSKVFKKAIGTSPGKYRQV